MAFTIFSEAQNRIYIGEEEIHSLLLSATGVFNISENIGKLIFPFVWQISDSKQT